MSKSESKRLIARRGPSSSRQRSAVALHTSVRWQAAAGRSWVPSSRRSRSRPAAKGRRTRDIGTCLARQGAGAISEIGAEIAARISCSQLV